MKTREDKIALSVLIISIIMLGYGIWGGLFNNEVLNTPGADFAYYNWHTPAVLSLIYFFVRFKFGSIPQDMSTEV